VKADEVGAASELCPKATTSHAVASVAKSIAAAGGLITTNI